MSKRKKMPARRHVQTFSFEYHEPSTQKYHATVGYYDEELKRPGELFLNSSQKSGSAVDLTVSEAAIAVSLALQHGCKVQTLREACLRKSDGSPQTPVGRALDIMDDERPLKMKRFKT